MNIRTFLLTAIVFVCIALIIGAILQSPYISQSRPSVSDVPQTVTLEGTSVCLPHKDTSGPTTMECAFGLQTNDGNYYALDMSAIQTDTMIGFETGKRFSIDGMLVAIEQISSDQWQTYDIRGIVRVTSATKQ